MPQLIAKALLRAKRTTVEPITTVVLFRALAREAACLLWVAGTAICDILRVGAKRAAALWESTALCNNGSRRLALFNPLLQSGECVELVGRRPSAAVRHTGNKKKTGERCGLFRAANRLTSEERQRTITRASESTPEPQTIRDEFLTIDLTSFHKEVEERLGHLQAAQKIVVSDPEILSGTPVIQGTRVPVYDVAASVAGGIPIERILAAYPSLKQKQIELAALYVEANLQRGRPRQKTSLPPNAKILSRRTETIFKLQ